MKPLTKTVVSRGGGIAARFAPAPPPDKLSPKERKLWKKRNAKLAEGAPVVANAVANPVANVANKPRYAKWREANPELWLERQRGYQAKHRQRRAKAKDV